MLPFGLRTKGIVLMCCMDDMLYLRIFACTLYKQRTLSISRCRRAARTKTAIQTFLPRFLCESPCLFLYVLELYTSFALHLSQIHGMCMCAHFRLPMYEDGTMKTQNLAATAKAEATTTKMLYNHTCKAQQTRLKKAPI